MNAAHELWLEERRAVLFRRAAPRRGRPRKDEVCAACGTRQGAMLLNGKLVLVLACGGCETPTHLCASCIGNRRHRCDTGVTR